MSLAPDPEVVERVAKALWLASWKWEPTYEWTGEAEPRRDAYREQARVAIRALGVAAA